MCKCMRYARNLKISYGEYYHLAPQIRQDLDKFKEYFRMTPATFNHLLLTVQPIIEKKTTNWRKPIPPEERLAVT